MHDTIPSNAPIPQPVQVPLARFWRELPNHLTMLRLAMVPLFVAFMMDPSQLQLRLATAIFILAAITDYVDGFLARRFGAVSDFGKLFDPLVDKILVMAALVMLVAQRSDVNGLPWVPAWMVVFALGRELWVTGLRGVAAARGMIVAARPAGKVKSGLQMVAIVFLLLHDLVIPVFGWGVRSTALGLNALFLSIIFSYWSAIEYTRAVLLEDRS